MRTATLGFLLAVPALVSALSITAPTKASMKGNSTVTIEWTSKPNDPTSFTIELVNAVGALSQGPIAVANNVQTSLGTLTLGLPGVPAASGYTLTFVDIFNINNVYATSRTFALTSNPIKDETSTVEPTTSTTSTKTSVTLPAPITTKAVTPTSTPGQIEPSTITLASTAVPTTIGTGTGASSASAPASTTGGGIINGASNLATGPGIVVFGALAGLAALFV